MFCQFCWSARWSIKLRFSLIFQSVDIRIGHIPPVIVSLMLYAEVQSFLLLLHAISLLKQTFKNCLSLLHTGNFICWGRLGKACPRWRTDLSSTPRTCLPDGNEEYGKIEHPSMGTPVLPPQQSQDYCQQTSPAHFFLLLTWYILKKCVVTLKLESCVQISTLRRILETEIQRVSLGMYQKVTILCMVEKRTWREASGQGFLTPIPVCRTPHVPCPAVT